MRSFPAHFTWVDDQPVVCILDREVVEDVNRAYEEEGEVELVDGAQRIAMEDWRVPQEVILISPGGEGKTSGGGTGMPWESFCWYAKPEAAKVWLTRSGPSTGCYSVCRVHLRVKEGADQRPRTWWGYANGYPVEG